MTYRVTAGWPGMRARQRHLSKIAHTVPGGLSRHPLTNDGAGVVHHHDSDADEPQGCAGLVPLQKLDVLRKQKADPATTHQPDHRGEAYVDIPAIHRERDELGNH